MSRAIAGALSEEGFLTAGDRLLLSGASSVAYAAVHLAALRLGLVVVPVNPAYRDREVAHIARDCRPKAVVSEDRADLGVVAQSIGTAHWFPLDLAALEPLPSGPAPRLDEAGPSDPALLIYTSGTTGSPKGALLSHRNLLANALAVAQAWRITPADRLVLPLPLFHVHGLCVGLQACWAAGASVVLRPGFDRADVARAIGEKRASLLFAVPTIYARLRGEGALRRLRLAVSGSAPLPPDLHAELAADLGQVILERYGMSEALMIATNPYEGERRPGTVGGPFPGVSVRLGEADGDGTAEVLVRSPSLLSGYLGQPEQTAASFEDGWFKTGDLGLIEEGGYLRLVGRKTELIITGGYNVYPREVEDALRRRRGVADAAVVGEPDPVWGEVVVAYIETSEPRLDEERLLSELAEELAPYKLPRRVDVVRELPRNALGKVVKAELGRAGG